MGLISDNAAGSRVIKKSKDKDSINRKELTMRTQPESSNNKDQLLVNSWKQYFDKLIDYCIEKSASTDKSRGQFISDYVGLFVWRQLVAVYPCEYLDSLIGDDEMVDITKVLNAVGEVGTRIGALAYVLAVRLQAILDDGTVTRDIRQIVTYPSGLRESVENNPEQIPVSRCYIRYLKADPFVFYHFLEPYLSDEARC